MGIFNNIGNFGRKVSEFNAERREKNLVKLRTKAQEADVENKKIEEEIALRKQLAKNTALKKDLSDQKLAKVKGIAQKFSELGDKFEKADKGNKFDVLGSGGKKDLPDMFGNAKVKNL